MSGNNNKIIYFLSASDRINYGDLLFPLVFRAIHPDSEFRNFGIRSSDLSHFSALPTYSYRKLLRELKRENITLLIGGGEVFFANWKTLYRFINPLYRSLSYRKWFHKLDKRYDLCENLLCNKKVKVPFCPGLDELGNADLNICYSSVGGGENLAGKSDNYLVHVKNCLKQSEHLSVRDKRTQENLRSIGVDSILVPDSALLISDIYSLEFLNSKKSLKDNLCEDYLFLQLGRFKKPRDLKRFSEDIHNLSERLKLRVILCPIGKAPGHEDDLVLKELAALDQTFSYIEPKNIFDIMLLIARSRLYLGTSLHGVITAQSFDIPFVALNKNLPKVESYIQTWINDEMVALNFDEIEKVDNIYLTWNYNDVKKRTHFQKRMIRQNFKEILRK
ncbi:polysaccharide pyruvyl transferase family protein [Gramella sp. KN1008]|uniref:polysaccharide pyruvyl transferase family protein n=1 Tax=Gramella sp. KN1008 TaxID=2529298 RepID=UPI00103D66AB|nr:polysaccharide pyruvyl transferase family protein [Gramella sp. KN1008]TBW25559.1 polysaccharide pyruvyl transferase family protein [Gramella sp. KN1008]